MTYFLLNLYRLDTETCPNNAINNKNNYNNEIRHSDCPRGNP